MLKRCEPRSTRSSRFDIPLGIDTSRANEYLEKERARFEREKREPDDGEWAQILAHTFGLVRFYEILDGGARRYY